VSALSHCGSPQEDAKEKEIHGEERIFRRSHPIDDHEVNMVPSRSAVISEMNDSQIKKNRDSGNDREYERADNRMHRKFPRHLPKWVF
jgi:hypothetical protein